MKNELHELEVKLIKVKGKIIEYKKKLKIDNTSETVSELKIKKSEEKILIEQIDAIKSQLITMSNEFERRKAEYEANLHRKIDAILKPTYLEVARRALENDKKDKSDSTNSEQDPKNKSDAVTAQSEISEHDTKNRDELNATKSITLTKYALQSDAELEDKADKLRDEISEEIDMKKQIELNKVGELECKLEAELEEIKLELEIRIISANKKAKIKAMAAEERSVR